MRYAFIASMLIVLGLSLTTGVGRVAPAYACSAGEDFDPVGSSAIVVGGWVGGWRERPDISADPGGDYRSLAVLIQVDRVFKGPPTAQVEAIDYYMQSGDRWIGSSCSVFGGDPTGKYVILGLWRDEAGLLHPNSLRTFFIGSQPAGESYDYGLARLGRFLSIAPPNTGSGGLLRDQ